VYWHSQDGFLYCAATDGYRLAERKLLETTSQIRAIIPTTTLQEVLRTLRDENEEIHVLFDETQVTFLMENIEITSRLIDGKFPDYRQLIPNESETSCTIKSNDFNRITKVAGLFARESGGGIILHINADKSTVSVQSIASEIGENNSELPVETQGVGGTVSLNSKYLTDALSVIDAQNISFGFSGKLAPCVLQKASKSTNYKHIIMPLKS
jgi:DNA polymerase-3 subunit beta